MIVLPNAPIYKTYEPNPRQAQFHAIRPWNPTLIKGAIGGLGGGKTTACEQEQALVCLKTPNGKSIAVRESMNRSDISLIEDYQVMLQGVAKWVASKSWFQFDNGHKLIVTPADKWDRFGSTQFVSFYIQEAQEVDFKIFDTLTQRLRNPHGMVNGIPWFRGYFDARGVKREHWIYKEFVKQAWNADDGDEARKSVKNPNYAWLKFTTYDNEKHLIPGYIKAQLDSHKDNVPWIKMLIEGEFGFDIEGRPVFESYRPELHDAEIVPDRSLPILRGWDFGYNRPAVVWSQYTRDGRLLVLREHCPVGTPLNSLCQEVVALQRDWFPDHHDSQYKDYGDIAGKQANATGPEQIEFVEQYFNTVVESAGKLRVNVGLEIMRNLMLGRTKQQQPRFAVDYSCERLREALGGAYYYSMDKTDERPIKGEGYDDVVDAVRYTAQCIVEEVPHSYRPWGGGPTAFARY